MGPISRYLGPWVPEPQLWQDPVPEVDHPLIGEQDIAALKGEILASGLSVSQLVATAWAAAASFRGTDKRGGANGARIRLAPQRDWEVNEPVALAKVLETLEGIQQDFNSSQAGGKRVSLADLIVLGGCAAVEQAARNAGHDVTVPFTPGRTDASQEQTDVESFAVLEPRADGFRNYVQAGQTLPPETLLLDRANMLTLTAPEMTVARRRHARPRRQPQAVQARRLHRPARDVDERLLHQPAGHGHRMAGGRRVGNGSPSTACTRAAIASTGEVRWTATAVDLVFGSHSQLRAIAEVYACDDAQETFVRDFVAAWDKVMNLDRFDLARAG